MTRSPDLAAEGLGRIRWAEQFMPALADARRVVTSEGRLSGRRVGIVLTLEPKAAVLAVALERAGAAVSVHSPASHTDERVAAALESLGVGVFARSDADAAGDRALMDGLVGTHPEFLIDDRAAMARHIHTHRRDALEALRGIAEETTSGVRALRVMERQGALEAPCIAAVGFRKCVDLAANRTIPLNAHHAHIHTGKAGVMLETKAGHAVVPTAPITPWVNCAALEEALPILFEPLE